MVPGHVESGEWSVVTIESAVEQPSGGGLHWLDKQVVQPIFEAIRALGNYM